MSPFDVRRSAANPALLIGAAVGSVFLLANSGAPLPRAWGAAIKAVGVLAFLVVLLTQFLRAGSIEHRPDFGRPFRLVVAGELLAGLAGLTGLRLFGAPAPANIAWIALVVGLHFVALAVVWGDVPLCVVGAAMAAVGLAGLAMAAAGLAVAWIPVLSGVGSGLALLGGSLAASLATQVPGASIPVRAQGTSPLRR